MQDLCISQLRMFEKILSGDIPIFTETRFGQHDPDEIYANEGYELFRNDETSNDNHPYHGTAVYSRLQMLNGCPTARNCHEIEVTIAKTVEHPHLIIIGIY